MNLTRKYVNSFSHVSDSGEVSPGLKRRRIKRRPAEYQTVSRQSPVCFQPALQRLSARMPFLHVTRPVVRLPGPKVF